jgi:colicin import membrane protein
VTYDDVTRNEKAISGSLALAMHLMFLGLLVFGVSWQKKEPDTAVVVDLWNNLPPVAQPKSEAPVPPPPRPEPKPAPKPEPKPVPKEAKPPPPVKAAPKPEPKAPAPDIALKEKLEKQRIEKDKVEQDQKRKEREKADAKKREEEKAAAQAQAKEAEAKREQVEAQNKLAAAQAAARQKSVDEFKRRIAEKVRRFIVEPPNLQGNPEVEFDVVMLPGGEVLGVKLRRPSGVAAYDNAVERAILKAQPLPVPPDPAAFKDFRELNMKFRPKD